MSNNWIDEYLMPVVDNFGLAPVPGPAPVAPLAAPVVPAEAPIPEIDLSQTVAPLEEVPAHAAPVVTPEAEPQMAREKTGSTSTTTKTVIPSAESAAAMGEYEKALEAEQQATIAQGEADAKVVAAESKKRAADAEVRAQVSQAFATSIQKAVADRDNMIKSRDQYAAELTNQPEETFWGSKSTGDKIAAAISVGLGGYAQAMLGGGQNLGLILLERQMDEFRANQNRKQALQTKRLETMNISINDKSQAINQLKLQADATEIAMLNRVEMQFATIAEQAKTSQVKAAAAQKAAQIGAKKQEKMLEMNQRYDTETSQNVQRDTIEMVKRTPGFDKDGNPVKLTEGQAASRIFYGRMTGASELLLDADEDALAADDLYRTVLATEKTERRNAESGTLGRVLEVISDTQDVLVGGNVKQLVAKTRPDINKYVTAKEQFIAGVLRKESGSAIGASEYGSTDRQYFAQPGDSKQVIAQKKKLRQQALRDMRIAAGLGEN